MKDTKSFTLKCHWWIIQNECESEIKMDKEFSIGTLPSLTETVRQDKRMDQGLKISDLDSDQELSMHEYVSWDTVATVADDTSHAESRLDSKGALAEIVK